MNRPTIVRLRLGLFSVPGAEIAKYRGLTVRAPYVVSAYVVRVPGLTVLFDTAVAGGSEAVDRHRPRCFNLEEQLSAIGLGLTDIDAVVYCHLHADHAGGNHRLPGVPIYVQRGELEAAAAPVYTVRRACLDFPGATLVRLRGPERLAEDLQILPTPGHSPGHQSLTQAG